MAKKKSKKKKGEPLVPAELQVEILALGLLALAVFTFLALLPVSAFGPRATEWFPSGNPVGVVGGTVDALLVLVFGPVVAFLVPLLLALGGLRLGGWGPEGVRRWIARGVLLVVGLLLILPVAMYTLAPDPASGGWIGEEVGGPLVGLVGILGTVLLLAVLLVVLSVLTLRWNPVTALGKGAVAGGSALGRGMRSLGTRLGEWREARAAKRAAAEDAGRVPDAAIPDEEPDAPFAPEGREDDEPEEDAGGGTAEPEALPEPTPPPLPEVKRAPSVEELLPDPTHPDHLTDGELPPLDLLEPPHPERRQGMEKELEQLGEVLVDKLKTFNVDSELAGRTTGPVVTQFEVVPAPGVKVNRIANLDADLALAMRAPSVRIVAPIPGKGAVGVEIPNPEPQIVQLREILDAKEFEKARGVLPLGLGKDLTGRPYVADLAKMPHVLIAGATGSGKSVCINTIITSMVYRHTPETLRLLMIDPKMVELSAYADLPHLRHPVVTDPEEAAGVLKWAVLEMERRYQLLSQNGVRSIAEFNARVRDGVTLRRAEARDGAASEGDEDRWIYDDGVLPYVVVVVDELADLMMQVQSEVEKPLAQLAQKARAIGIHLIVATQRPSVNVITGLIKANFPTRIAFRVASKTDSRTILDQNGAEALLGNGDMLFLPPGQSEPVRIQGAYIATEETDRLIAWFRAQEAHRIEAEEEEGVEPAEEPDILEEVRASEQIDASDIVEEVMEDWDELFKAAAEVCITNDQGSTSLLQRRLKIGYGRAARIIDQLHDAGIVGPPDGSKPREVLVGLDALDLIMAGKDAPDTGE